MKLDNSSSIAKVGQSIGLMTVPQFAARAGIGKTNAWKLVKTGAIGSIQLGKSRRISEPQYQEFLDRNSVEPVNAAREAQKLSSRAAMRRSKTDVGSKV